MGIQKVTENWGVGIVPNGDWRRIKGATPTGSDDTSRPHVVPLTDEAIGFVDADYMMSLTGLCVGQLRKSSKSKWISGYRFLEEQSMEALHKICRRLEKLLNKDFWSLD